MEKKTLSYNKMHKKYFNRKKNKERKTGNLDQGTREKTSQLGGK